MLTPNERVFSALAHREPDRVPIDLGATVTSGISIHAYRRWLNHVGLRDLQVELLDPIQQLAVVHEEALSLIGVDTRAVFLNPPAAFHPVYHSDGSHVLFHDEWGTGWGRPLEGEWFYHDPIHYPLAHCGNWEEMRNHPWPDPNDMTRYEGVPDRTRDISESGFAPCLTGIRAGVMELALCLRGHAQFYADMAEDPGLAGALMDKIIEIEIAGWEHILPTVRDVPLIVFEGDDLGSQRGPLVSPGMYRKLLKPRHRTLFSTIKKLSPNVRIFFHTCGSVSKFLPDLIEVGVDILNPVQTSARDMEPSLLKKEFGKDLVFWGGGVDTQTTLPKLTPSAVRDEVKRRIDELAPGGGFVFATVHNIQADVPPENVAALFEAAVEFGLY